MCKMNGEEFVTLYRGLSNIYQLREILKYETAGGYQGMKLNCQSCESLLGCISCKWPVSYVDIKNKKTLISKQTGTHAENTLKVVNIVDNSRYLIEYTKCRSIAQRYASFAYIEVCTFKRCTQLSLSNYKSNSEQGVYCESCAPIGNVFVYWIENVVSNKVFRKLLDKNQCLKYIEIAEQIIGKNGDLSPKIFCDLFNEELQALEIKV